VFVGDVGPKPDVKVASATAILRPPSRIWASIPCTAVDSGVVWCWGLGRSPLPVSDITVEKKPAL